ncbi:hypothetical protein AG0111_0g8653 [Alternaria gaisen]|uniref:Uncharacterized protein n=1 Tax=Alternaria gaisen TaxID=167740 RepID=A0ACB6FGN3_9PLEO|nr:hypothetical protein AG0111_0g8653 [Alternaria gaisen]
MPKDQASCRAFLIVISFIVTQVSRARERGTAIPNAPPTIVTCLVGSRPFVTKVFDQTWSAVSEDPASVETYRSVTSSILTEMINERWEAIEQGRSDFAQL